MQTDWVSTACSCLQRYYVKVRILDYSNCMRESAPQKKKKKNKNTKNTTLFSIAQKYGVYNVVIKFIYFTSKYTIMHILVETNNFEKKIKFRLSLLYILLNYTTVLAASSSCTVTVIMSCLKA